MEATLNAVAIVVEDQKPTQEQDAQVLRELNSLELALVGGGGISTAFM